MDKASTTSRSSSRSSLRSNATSTSSYAARAKAKAEAARTRLSYLESEGILMKQSALIKVDLQLLKERRLCAEAEAEAKAYQYVTIDEYNEGDSKPPSIVESKIDRTERYVKDNTDMKESFVNHNTSTLRPSAETFRPNKTIESGDKSNSKEPLFNNTQSQQFVSNEDIVKPEQDRFMDVLLKKDLLVSRFQKFDDQPSNYQSWKASYKNITKQINLKAHEEIDLIVNHLGQESRKQALSIKAANAADPFIGLIRLWERLDERYGAPELIECSLKKKLANFPNITTRDPSKLYELSDILAEIESFKDNSLYASSLAYFDSSAGVNPIVAKLPYHIQNRWVERASRFKSSMQMSFPPFSVFVDFIRGVCKTMNDPCFLFDSTPRETQQRTYRSNQVVAKKTEMQFNKLTQNTEKMNCPIHTSSSHSLDECREFTKKDLAERKLFLREKGICYKCCKSVTHIAKNCTHPIKCTQCNSTKHTTALHVVFSNIRRYEPKVEQKHENKESSGDSKPTEKCDGGEPVQTGNINNKCTTVCGEGFSGRSCAKTVLVKVFPDGRPEKSVNVYAILDDQSNRTLATTDLIDSLNVDGQIIQYELTSCAGKHKASGRKIQQIRVQSMDGTCELPLDTVFECNEIPQDPSEIPTPDIAKQFPHLERIAKFIPPLPENIKISLLIGRDMIEAHHVKEQIVGCNQGSPFAQRLGLGWVIIGDVCLGKVHAPIDDRIHIHSFKTHVIDNVSDRVSIFQPCEASLNFKELKSASLFEKTKEDEKIGLSVEDREFLKIMNNKVIKSEDGKWTAPLPFRQPKPKLSNNRQMAWKRAMILQANLNKNEDKREHFVTFMEKVISSGAAEVAPEVPEKKEVWYLPFFGVYNPRKPGQVRGVFDSSATFEGVSLNGALLPGPNLTNSLLGILLRFRQHRYAVAADVEQMFYSFLVQDDHRDYLRFFWYRDNNPNLELIEYRMRAHVFGNSPSPAVATYCLRKSVEKTDIYGQDVHDFVNRNFYVDDGLASLPTISEAVSLVQKTQTALQTEGQIRLHKIISNSAEIMQSFPKDDVGKEIKALNLDKDPLPTHQSLGLLWDLNKDCFRFSIQLQEKPCTRRGFLSTLNSIYDPLGFVAPITIQGKILMREIIKGADWDEQLEPNSIHKWKAWTDTLESLRELSIPRMFVDQSSSTVDNTELHIFSDASEKAVCAVAYMKTVDKEEIKAGFVMGKAKIAPTHGHTIPRLELCGALLATQLGEVVAENLDLSLKGIKYYTDSKVVLGYI